MLSFYLISLGKTFDTFSFKFDKESILKVEEHVDEGVTECKVFDTFENILVAFGRELYFRNFG